MGRNKMTAEAIQAAGRTHVTKNDIEERKSTAPKVIADNIRPPDFITDEEQVKEFYEIAEELVRIGVMGNLDCYTLGMFVCSKTRYSQYETTLQEIMQKNQSANQRLKWLPKLKEFEALKDKNFRECLSCANAMGLTITSRCKLVAPKEAPPENKFNKFLEGHDENNQER